VCDSVHTIAGIDETLKAENAISYHNISGWSFMYEEALRAGHLPER
jgi:hypothetical protein